LKTVYRYTGKDMNTTRRRWTGLLAALLTMAGITRPSHAASEQVQTQVQPTWIATWIASPEARWNGDFPLPTNLPHQLWDQTVRQVARVSIGGSRVRIVLSNAYGTRPLKIGAADIARSGKDASIVPGSNRVLTFGGKTTVVIPPGAPMLSDPVDLDVAALSHLAVSLYLPDPTAPATFHWDARQTAYVGAGNQTAATSLKVDSTLTTRVFLAAIQVEAAPGTRTVVAFGDSFTDGDGATMDADARWPDFLAQRLALRDVAALIAGISGARVLRDKMGVNALARFQRDVLAQPGIRTVIALMGINDIAWKDTPLALSDESTTVQDLIAGYQQLIARAHACGVRIIGATLTPFEGALDDTPMRDYYSANKERIRQQVNDWIRHSGAFDAVIDFDAILRDPTHPTRLLPAYDSGDHLHPGDAGNRVMAKAINLHVLLGD
jgi:lysophospholipase L1-like esterase